MDKTNYQTFFAANQSLWNKKTKFHATSAFYDVKAFLKGRNSLQNIELKALGDVKNKHILHLQCHFGLDSLSLARMGAKVTGIDLSDESIKLAKKLNKSLGLDARFVQGNVYDTPQLIQEQFDLVYTSYGVITWLPDLDLWAEVIQKMLKPGGVFYIVEFHPLFYIFNENNQVTYPYFNTGKVFHEKVEGSYAAPEADIHEDEYFWCHSLDELVSALLKQNLELLEFREFDFSPYLCFPNLIERAEGEYCLNFPLKLPHTFSVKARKTHS